MHEQERKDSLIVVLTCQQSLPVSLDFRFDGVKNLAHGATAEKGQQHPTCLQEAGIYIYITLLGKKDLQGQGYCCGTFTTQMAAKHEQPKGQIRSMRIVVFCVFCFVSNPRNYVATRQKLALPLSWLSAHESLVTLL